MSAYYLEQARRFLAAKDLHGALDASRKAVATAGADAETWFVKGSVELALSRPADARESARRAIESRPQDARYWILAGTAEQDLGDLASARSAYEKAAALAPKASLAWHRLGTVCFELGDAGAAESAFARALEADPANARAWNNLGHARLEAGRLDEAEQAFRRALDLQPDYALAFHNLARIALARAELAKAGDFARVANRLEPGLVDAALLHASVLRRTAELSAAREIIENILQARPDHVAARTALAELLAEEGAAGEAREHYRRAQASRPAALRPALGAHLLLPPVYDSLDDLRRWRRGYAEGLSRLEEIRESFSAERPEALARDAQWTNFYLAYQGEEDVELQRRYGEFLAGVLSKAFPGFYSPGSRRPRGKRIRAGFASRFFFDGTVGRYFASWIAGMDRTRFECRVYSLGENSDSLTQALAASSDAFIGCAGLPLPRIARTIADDGLDVLVYPELGMHGATFALASMRLAPVQVAAWGHPVTSGHPNIDHYLSVQAMEPPQAAKSYTERLHMLPGLGTRYGSPPTPSRSSAEALGLPADRHRYMVPQSLFKIHPDNDRLFVRILEEDPDAHLLFFAARQSSITNRFVGRLAAAGIRERTTVLPYMTHERYLQVNAACDVMLDTLHWSGGNTSLDALAAGLPLVTLPGRYMRGRQSYGMLSLLDLPELVARDESDYVRKATGIARDRAAREELRNTIASRRGELFDRRDALEALQDFLEGAVAAT